MTKDQKDYKKSNDQYLKMSRCIETYLAHIISMFDNKCFNLLQILIFDGKGFISKL